MRSGYSCSELRESVLQPSILPIDRSDVDVTHWRRSCDAGFDPNDLGTSQSSYSGATISGSTPLGQSSPKRLLIKDLESRLRSFQLLTKRNWSRPCIVGCPNNAGGRSSLTSNRLVRNTLLDHSSHPQLMRSLTHPLVVGQVAKLFCPRSTELCRSAEPLGIAKGPRPFIIESAEQNPLDRQCFRIC